MSKKSIKKTDLSDPTNSQTFKTWLARHIAASDAEIERGPGGTGWAYNESLREEIETLNAALHQIEKLTE